MFVDNSNKMMLLKMNNTSSQSVTLFLKKTHKNKKKNTKNKTKRTIP